MFKSGKLWLGVRNYRLVLSSGALTSGARPLCSEWSTPQEASWLRARSLKAKSLLHPERDDLMTIVQSWDG